VDDLLSEREQWEWIKAQVRENGPAVLLAIVVGLGAVYGYRAWQSHMDAGRLAAGAQYIAMVHALEHGDRTQALSLLGDLEREHAGSPYTDQAKLLAARVYVDDNELDRAASELDNVVTQSKDKDLALIARLRLARVQIAQNKADNALATLTGIEPANSFAARAHEVRGDAYYAKGDSAKALAEYRSAKQGGGADADTQLLDLKIADLSAGK
jgi:predicted negative regulator of RcsB-dependent stress response